MTSRSPTRVWRVALVALLTTLALALLFQGANGLAPQRALAARLGLQIISQWTFEPAPTPPTPPTPSTGAGTASRGPGLGGESYPAGDGSAAAWSFTGWTTAASPDLPNDYVQFAVSTVGYTNISFGFAERRSGTGIRTLEVHYSTDGTNFTLFPGSVTGVPDDTNFRTHLFDLSAITALDNNPNAAFRIYGYSAEAGTGTWRFDDVTISGEPPAGSAEVAVDKSGPATAQPNDLIAYVIQVDSQGASPAANVTITDTLPAQVSYQSYSSSTPLTFTNNAPTLIWDAGTVMTGTSIFITVNVQVSPLFSQTITNTVQVATTSSGDTPGNNQASASTAPPVGGTCGQPFTAAYTIQGTGSASPMPNNTPVTVEGIVTGDFQGTSGLNGFYLQDATGDGNPASSDGLFIFTPSGTDVSVGQRVRVSGEVVEFTSGSDTLTEITNVSSILICGPAALPAATVLDLPVAAMADFERYENMLVTLPETMTASEVFNIGRFGEVVVSADGRLYQPTNFNAPGAPSQAAQDLNNRRSFILDDGSNTQNPAVVPYLAPDNTLRLGDTTTNLTGVMTFGFSRYRMQPTAPVTFTRVNNRTAAPAAVGGTVSVASFNVLNYFTTIDNGSNGARGADSAIEFTRQRTKTINAIVDLDADIVGLIELENNGAALQDLLTGINLSSTVPYTIVPGLPATYGTDAIKVSIIYRPSVVNTLGNAMLDMDLVHNRPPVAQVFEKNGQIFTVIINHFKSKSCTGATGGDTDQGDGQSCYNATRIAQAQQLLTFISGIQGATGDSDFVIMGDLNAYAMEDPIGVLETAGYSRLSSIFLPLAEQYSYVFQGQAGELDHLMTSASLTGDVSGMTVWHINSDEPIDLDYNDDVLTSGESAAEYNQPYLYQPFGYRSSDHDPALAGLNLVLPVAAFSAPDYLVPEASGSGTITVTLSSTADLTGTVQYQTLDGTATAGADYTTTAGTLTFAPGATSATFTVPVLDDALLEGNETVILELQPLDVGGQPSGSVVTATLTIVDDEAPTAVTLTELGARSGTPLASLVLAGLVLLAAGLLRLRRR